MKNFFKNFAEKIKANKKKTIVISVVAFVTVCVVITVCCLSAFLFNRFATGYVPTDEQLAAAGIPAGLIRLSCGLEDKEDLVADLKQALEAV